MAGDFFWYELMTPDQSRLAGGQVLMGPNEVHGGQWIVQGMDPQGANFALLSATK